MFHIDLDLEYGVRVHFILMPILSSTTWGVLSLWMIFVIHERSKSLLFRLMGGTNISLEGALSPFLSHVFFPLFFITFL